MGYEEEEKMYEDIRSLLGGLKQITVPPNFDSNLMRRINAEKFSAPEPWWKKIFITPRLIPSAALALTIIAVLFVLNSGTVDPENPLLSEPRIREDLIVNSSDDESLSPASKIGIELEGNYSKGSTNARVVSYGITKSGLNFRQLHLSAEERAEIEKMRQKLIQMFNQTERN